jgi:hypothetical protein
MQMGWVWKRNETFFKNGQAAAEKAQAATAQPAAGTKGRKVDLSS